VKPSDVTVGDFLERWIQDYARSNLSPRTVEGYDYVIHRHLVPGLGSALLMQLGPEQVQRYYAEKLRSGLSPTTVRHHHMVLHNTLKKAVKWGMLARNPLDAVTPPKAQPAEMHTLDEDDVRRLLEAARSSPYHALFYTALYRGMRRSELLALRWSDVDLDLAQISVNRTLHHLRDGGVVFRPPKTAKSRRTIALPPSAALVLREHQEGQQVIWRTFGAELRDSDLVFCQPDGTPLLPNTVTHAWVKLVRSIGLGGVRLHDARHTHASLMLKQGVHPKVVQERLGHSSIQMTLDTYSHVAPGLQNAAALSFDESLAKNTSQAGPKKGLVSKMLAKTENGRRDAGFEGPF